METVAATQRDVHAPPEALLGVFDEVQDGASFTECLARAVALGTAPVPFAGSGLQAVIHVLLQVRRNAFPPAVARLCRRLFEELHATHPERLAEVAEYLLGLLGSRSTTARRHALRLLAVIVNATQLELPPAGRQAVAERLFDREASVRRAAVRLALLFQASEIAPGLPMRSTLKDLVRHDPLADIRRRVLAGLDSCPETRNCIVERAVDESAQVRRAFWQHVFPILDCRTLPREQRVFLMRTAFLEREFDARGAFLQALRGAELDEVAELFYSREPTFDALLSACLASSYAGHALPAGAPPGSLSPGRIRLATLYCERQEQLCGREALQLLPLEELIAHITALCGLLANDPVPEQRAAAAELVQSLQQYDTFTGDARRVVMKSLHALLTRYAVREVVDAAVQLAPRVCGSETVPFLASIIKKTADTPLCVLVAEAVLVHLPADASASDSAPASEAPTAERMHDAILSEIALKDPGAHTRLIFWYIVRHRQDRPVAPLIEQLLALRPAPCAVEAAVDLVLLGVVPATRVVDELVAAVEALDAHAAVPLAKLVLAGHVSAARAFQPLLLTYYGVNDESVQQFLALFLPEQAARDPDTLILCFCPVLEQISANQRVFIDQVLHWLAPAGAAAQQRLYSAVCTYILRNYTSLCNKRFLFMTLERILPSPEWPVEETKTLIALITFIMRRRPRENTQLLLSRLLEVDDGIPLAVSRYEQLREELEIDR